jgi:hypothetical protein
MGECAWCTWDGVGGWGGSVCVRVCVWGGECVGERAGGVRLWECVCVLVAVFGDRIGYITLILSHHFVQLFIDSHPISAHPPTLGL